MAKKFLNKWVWVTGASSGIGRSIAVMLAKESANLVLVARRQDELKKVREEAIRFGAGDVELIAADLSQIKSGQDVLNQADFQEKLKTQIVPGTHGLVNSAGLALGSEPFDQNSVSSIEQVMQTNVLGLLHFTHALLPALKSQRGHIVNLGSVAGHWTYPGGTVYCASKAAVRAITEGLRMDLMGSGVRVTNIEPGMVETEFSQVRFGDAEKARAVYQGMQPLSADDVAETILWCMLRPSHVNIQELMIFPTDQAGVGYVHRKEIR